MYEFLVVIFKFIITVQRARFIAKLRCRGPGQFRTLVLCGPANAISGGPFLSFAQAIVPTLCHATVSLAQGMTFCRRYASSNSYKQDAIGL